jgi:release factor glutamine methyltransferase
MTTELLSVRALVLEGTQCLAQTSESPRLDAEILLAFVRGCDRLKLLVDTHEFVSAQQAHTFRQMLTRRSRHEPVAYIVGKKEFFGREFLVTPAVLIPRPDTELLVEETLRRTAQLTKVRVLDLGTGSGCIIISLVAEMKKRGQKVQAVAVDLSGPALAVAAENAKHLGVAQDITFLSSNWTAAVQSTFDVVVSNPPYIEIEAANISPELQHEPQSALYSGSIGLDDIRQLILEVPRVLEPRGLFLCETGAGQHAALAKIYEQTRQNTAQAGAWASSEWLCDLAGNERLMVLRRGERA